MIFIAHRANLDGPYPRIENHPYHIALAIQKGFYVEVDLRYIDKKWWLGHDEPQYEVDIEFLSKYRDKLFIHAKDIKTLHELISLDINSKYLDKLLKRYSFNYFFHDNDDCTLTSQGYIWTYPKASLLLTKRSIAVMPERVSDWKIDAKNCYGICTDYPIDYRSGLKPLETI